MRLGLQSISLEKIAIQGFLRRSVGTDDERTAARFGQEPAATQISTTPEPRDGWGVAGSAPSSSLARGWQRVVAFNARLNDSWWGDLIGGVSLFVGLWVLLFLMWGIQP